mmetsp:Transcript_23724/g.29471  ORF Transcript_23724/g.29471 Transcript_23724/m.29471 type:complete len:143 (-) Transcript_23724:2904-3332(-)
MLRQRISTLLVPSLRTRVQAQAFQAPLMLRIGMQNPVLCSQMGASGSLARPSSLISGNQGRAFSTKNDDNGEDPPVVKKRRGRPPKAQTIEAQSTEATEEKVPKKTRATRITKKAEAEAAAAEPIEKKAPAKRGRKAKATAA